MNIADFDQISLVMLSVILTILVLNGTINFDSWLVQGCLMITIVGPTHLLSFACAHPHARTLITLHGSGRSVEGLGLYRSNATWPCLSLSCEWYHMAKSSSLPPF
ncbi:hypothetical protein F5Y18DRAFT_281419 [Xylariaceae sp. FL1019]|nr:hypothetical protein F5Y18DRAFT_281419 [Xylariaceae sp. FL1019]